MGELFRQAQSGTDSACPRCLQASSVGGPPCMRPGRAERGARAIGIFIKAAPLARRQRRALPWEARPARRKPGRASQGTQIMMTQTNNSQVRHGPSSLLPIVKLAAARRARGLRSAPRGRKPAGYLAEGHGTVPVTWPFTGEPAVDTGYLRSLPRLSRGAAGAYGRNQEVSANILHQAGAKGAGTASLQTLRHGQSGPDGTQGAAAMHQPTRCTSQQIDPALPS